MSGSSGTNGAPVDRNPGGGWSLGAGITSRTLRHYDRVRLLAPSRVGANGYRYYDPTAVARLQRILLMRRLGMGLPAIAQVLAGEVEACDGLRAHIAALEEERNRIERQIRSVRHTLEALRAGTEPRMDVMLAGFSAGRPLRGGGLIHSLARMRWRRDLYRRAGPRGNAAKPVAFRRAGGGCRGGRGRRGDVRRPGRVGRRTGGGIRG
ncbi:MerR family transcriptional regulator [Streptosporangium sp. NBC_01810]|nr:MerR family transcriptional regulator [Streptosporangium sp. NBC_01810]